MRLLLLAVLALPLAAQSVILALGLLVAPGMSQIRIPPVYHHGWDGIAGGTFDWYVDSVNGNDSNTGKSIGQEFATIAALESAGIAAHDAIGLAAGSFWREQLDISVINVTVAAYGVGAKPLLDASDAILSGSWSKTGGRTNVYEATIEPGSNRGTNYIRIWEDDTRLDEVADIATCDSTVGSYHVVNHETTSETVYIHTSGSDDPGSNGSTYEFPKRDGGFDSTGAGVVLTGIHARRNLYGGGSIRVVQNARLTDVQADDGNVHNMQIGEGSILDTFVINRWWNGAATSVALNVYTGAAVGLDTIITNGTIDTQVEPYDQNDSCLGGHSNGASFLGSITVSNITIGRAGGIGGSFGDIGAGEIVSITNLSATDVNTGMYVFAEGQFIWDQITIPDTLTIYAAIRVQDGSDFTLSNSTLNLSAGTRKGVEVVGAGSTATSVTVTDTEIIDNGSYSFGALFVQNHTNTTLTADNVTFTFTTSDSRARYINIHGNTTLVSDHNTFAGTLRKFKLGGVDKTLDEWHALDCVRELNSTPTPTACP